MDFFKKFIHIYLKHIKAIQNTENSPALVLIHVAFIYITLCSNLTKLLKNVLRDPKRK